MTCDIFCHVIDNFGDAGVCWRLARGLSEEEGFRVTLYIDDAVTLSKITSGVTHIKLSPGCFLVMLSDGVADSLDDEWLQNLLAGWEGHDPQQLVAAILADSMEKRGGTDDAGVLALYIPEDSGGAQAV